MENYIVNLNNKILAIIIYPIFVWYFLIKPIYKIYMKDNERELLPISEIIGTDFYDFKPKNKLIIGIIMSILFLVIYISTGYIVFIT